MTPEEREELHQTVTQALLSQIGPMSDLTRSLMAAKVDGLIDARKRFLAAEWPEWMIQSAIIAMITGRGDPTHDHGD